MQNPVLLKDEDKGGIIMLKVGDKVTVKQGLSQHLYQWWAVTHLIKEIGIVAAIDRTDFVDVEWPSGVVTTVPVQILNYQVPADVSNGPTDIEDYERAMRII